MRLPDPIANTTTEAYLAYKAGVLAENQLKPSLYDPYLHFDAWLAYWAGLTESYPVKGLGKNLLPFKAQSFSINGVTFSCQNGSLYLNGTSTAIIASDSAAFKDNLAFILPAGTYTVSKSGGTIGGSIRNYSTGNAIAGFNNNNPKTTFTVAESTKVYLGIYVDANRTLSDFEAKVQLEQGSSASSYEPYTGEPEMLCDEEALVAYLAGVTNTYPEEIKDPYDVRIVGYLKYLVSARWGRPDYPVTNEELYLSMMDAPVVPSGDPSSDIEIDDTAEAPFASLEVYGDTYQQTYSGKNLMPLSSVSVDNNNRETKFKIDLPAGTYTISFDIDSFSLGTNTSFGVSMSFVNSSNVQFADRTIITVNSSTTLGRKTYNFTITDDASSAYDSNIIVPLTQYNNGARVEISNIQIEQGSATSYEPYTGGTASPNPDYPQDVQVVTGEQTVTVTGKNLFDKDNITLYYYIASDGTVTSQTQWCITDYIAVRPETNYTYSGITNAGTAPYSAYYDKNKQLISTFKQTINPTTITTPPEAMYVRFSINLGGSPSDIYRFQLEQGSTATAYESYQGQSYEVNLGKNLFSSVMEYGSLTGQGEIPGTTTTNAIRTVDYIPVLPNTTYTVSNNNNYYNYIYQYNGNKNFIKYNSECPSYTFTTDANTRFIKLRTNAGTVENDLATKFQLEYGSTVTSYAPYFTPIELCKIGDYQDYIYKSGDDWYVHKECSKIIYDGSEDENWVYANGSVYPFRMDIADAAILTSSQALPPNIFSNYYTPRKWNYDAQTETLPDACITSTISITFAIRNVDIETLANFKTWLSSHNLINYYQLATPTDTQITNSELISQLDAIVKGGSYNGKTYIKVTATDPNLPALLKVEAYKYD